MTDRARYKRVTDLWVDGEVLILEGADETQDPPAPPTVVWVQKLNQFEHQEVRKDAEVAKARIQLVLREPDSPQRALLVSTAANMDRESLVTAIIANQFSEHMADAATSVQADPEWHERLDIIERTRIDTATEEEKKLVGKFSEEYFAEVGERVEAADTAERTRLGALDEDSLRKEHVDGVIESRGIGIYMDELRLGEVCFGVRICEATPSVETGKWDHAACTHERLYLDHEEVTALPDRAFGMYVTSFNRINVSARQAKDSGSRPTSSEPSLPASEVEESSPSSPAETSPAPAGTSA